MENRCFRDETLFEKGKHMSTLQKVPAAQPLRKANLEEYDLVVLGGGTGGLQAIIVIENY
jgi:hypothetical protein